MSTVQTDKAILKILSINLSRLKAESGWSYRDLEGMTGDSFMTIHAVVTGKSMPGAGVLSRLAEAFGVSVDSLLTAPSRREKEKAVSGR